jgi:hypothetical protein
VSGFNNWEFARFRNTCGAVAIYRAAEAKTTAQIHEVIAEDRGAHSCWLSVMESSSPNFEDPHESDQSQPF